MLKKTRIRIPALALAAVILLSVISGCAPAQQEPVNVPGEPVNIPDEPSVDKPDDTKDTNVQEVDPIRPDEIWAENMSANTTETVKSTMDLTDFDERYLRFISNRAEGNYMTSPLSFRYALGLLVAGAEGETKEELLRAFGVASEDEWISHCLDFNGFAEYFAGTLERDLKAFREDVERGWISPDSTEPYRALRVANSVWKAERISEDFKEGYRNSINNNYAAEYRTFTAENAIERINEWADIKTEHMIPKLLPEGYPTENLAVVLMNALYFKDSWQNSFDQGLTKEGEFHARNGETTKKEFMKATQDVLYYEDDDTQLVILPMQAGVYMAFVLGSTDGISEKISSANVENVRVTIPKMDLETDFSKQELVDFLEESGVKLAFDPENADFTAMIDHRVFVSDIIQKTRIKLDEEGVEAAAVTAIMVRDTAYYIPEEPKEFTADRPFSFYIYTTCNDTTAVMFAGEIVE